MRTASTAAQRRKQLAQFLEESIVSGRLRPGAKLPTEKELQKKFSASRSVVREILQTLQTKGLITSQRGSGSYVSQDGGQSTLRDAVSRYSTLARDGESFLELMDLRLLMECFCLRRWQGPRLRAGRIVLREKLEIMKASAADSEAFGRADIAFHQAIAATSDHKLFSSILHGLLAEEGVRYAHETYVDPDLIRQTLRDHQAILQALEANDPRLAESRLQRHLLNSQRHLQTLLAKAKREQIAQR